MASKPKLEFAVPYRFFAEYLRSHRHILHLSDAAIDELLNDLKPLARLCEVNADEKLRQDGVIL